MVLGRDPLCVHCLARGVITTSQHVDHVDNDAANNDLDNLQGLCGSCHSLKTASDMGKRVNGCDADGFPTYPNHFWNKK